MGRQRLRKLRTCPGEKTIQSRQSQASDSSLRSPLQWWPQESLGPGALSNPVCGFASVWEKQQDLEMLISWWPPGIQVPWRWTALLLLLIGRGMQKSDMKTWPLAWLHLGDEIRKTFDEKPHMYFVFQSFGTITSSPPNLHSPLVFHLYSQSRVVLSVCS